MDNAADRADHATLGQVKKLSRHLQKIEHYHFTKFYRSRNNNSPKENDPSDFSGKIRKRPGSADASTQRSQKRAGSTRIAIDMRDASILQITDPKRLQGGNLVLNWFFPYIQGSIWHCGKNFYQSYRDNAAAVYAQRNMLMATASQLKNE
jgi:hypothetical protein